MAKLVLNDIDSLANTASAKQALNENFTDIEAAIENTLSRNGATPNQMQADIDMNSNDLLNVQRVDAVEFYKNGVPFEQTVAYSNKLYQLLSGTGAQTQFALLANPGSLGNLYVSVNGSDLKPGIDYNYDGTTITFVVAPAAGTNNIYIRYDVALATEDSVLRQDLASIGKGAALVATVQTGLNAATRTQQERNRDRLSAMDFIGYNLSGSAAQALRTAIRDRTVTAADKANIVLGVQAACAAANARSGVAVHLPAGTYYLDGIDVSGMHGLAVIGDGPEATKIITDSATADVFKTTTESRYQTFADFTVTSSVTRTAGAFFSLALWKRGLLSHVRMTRWFNALYIPTAEVCTLLECYITDPSGYGDAMVLGTASTAGQVSGFNLINCFVRGCDDTTASPPVARYGIASYDVDAIFGFNCDIGSFKDCDLFIAPNARSANHHFVQCYFDATKDFDCIRMQGAGSKLQMTFNGCWIASGGKLTSGSVEACGLRALNTGSYRDINFIGTRFYNNSGSGVLLEMPGADFHFPGCTIYANGSAATTNRHGFKWLPASAATVGPSLDGIRFAGNAPKDISIGANGNSKCSIQGPHLESGIDYAAPLGKASGFDPTAAVVASATRPVISPFHDFVRVTGTTNMAGMDVTYPGHMVTLKFDGVLTVIDASQNFALVGNFTTAAGSTLTLRCDGATWWEVARANT